MSEKQRAVVTHEVDPHGDPDEPVIRLEDGRTTRPIWCDRYVLLGTEGWAEFVTDRNAWRFTPDE